MLFLHDADIGDRAEGCEVRVAIGIHRNDAGDHVSTNLDVADKDDVSARCGLSSFAETDYDLAADFDERIDVHGYSSVCAAYVLTPGMWSVNKKSTYTHSFTRCAQCQKQHAHATMHPCLSS